MNPETEKLAATRAERWHQAGNPLLSIETMREWLQRSGLVLYTARPQIGAPAPSLVEAALGTANASPALNETEGARNLLARLIAEGNAVPLNLMGAPGGVGTDVPDFVVSAGVFSYIFTLRGNKAWKQPPATSGPVKVSPLALATYEMLAAKVMMSSYDLATQLGKEVTEAAVLRSLTELWGQLRVIPVPQVDGSATLWELASSRFTKQIKAGTNAGQPTALSALISLYLGQSMAATEDEVESFLSPLAPRSRVRDVLHALLSARQLETLVIDGKTLLHVSGDVPALLQPAVEETAEVKQNEGDAPRISKFIPRPGSKIGTGLRSKPAFGSRPAFGGKPGYGKPAGDQERRPFVRDERSGGDRPAARFNKPRFDKPAFNKPSFDKPWEDRPARPAAEPFEGQMAASGDGAEERKPFVPRTYDRKPDRPSFGNRFGGERKFTPKPRFEGRQEGFSGGSNAAGASRPAGGDFKRREFTPRAEGEGFTPRKTFSKPGTFGRKREGGGYAERPGLGRPQFGGGEGRPPRREFGAGEGRPPRRDFGDRPAGGGFKKVGSFAQQSGTFKPREDRPYDQNRTSRDQSGTFDDQKKRSFSPRTYLPDRSSEGGEAPRKTYRKFDAPREGKSFGAKPFAAKSAGGKSFGAAKPFGAKPFGARPSGGSSFGAKPFGAKPFGAKPFGTGSSSDRPRPGGGGEGRPSFGDRKPAGGGFGKKPFSKPGGASRPGGPFAKFVDGGNKPFRKPGKPGGFSPSKRRSE